jgi:hypothetical protein
MRKTQMLHTNINGVPRERDGEEGEEDEKSHKNTRTHTTGYPKVGKMKRERVRPA